MCLKLMISVTNLSSSALRTAFIHRLMLDLDTLNTLDKTLFYIPERSLRRNIARLPFVLLVCELLRTPWGRRGFKVENTSSVSPACRKRRLNGVVCRNHRIKRVDPCRSKTGTLKNPAKCLWHWAPDRRYDFLNVWLTAWLMFYLNQFFWIIDLYSSILPSKWLSQHLDPAGIIFSESKKTMCLSSAGTTGNFGPACLQMQQ